MQQAALVLKAEKREKTGTQVSRELRKQHRVPAVIYGQGAEPEAIHLDYHDLSLELQHHHRLLEVELDGQKQSYLVKDVQLNHLGDDVIHVDLYRVRMDERVEVDVQIELKGTPAGAADGGVLEQLLSEVTVECPVIKIPEMIRLMVSDLQVGDTVTAGELVLPESVTLVSEPDTAVVTVRVPSEEEEEPVEEAGEAGDAEPEVITRDRKDDEGEDE